MALITCENVSLGYEGLTVAKDINFSIYQGDYLSVIGRNGSGKSTLLKALLRIKEPERGKIVYGGGLKQSEIGCLAQQTPVQKDFPASVFEVVLSGRAPKRGLTPFYSRADKKDALDKMELLGITNLKERCFRELSGGQRQRALLARAMCAAEKILFLDEPVTGLDPVVTTEFFNIINEMHKNGMTIVMVSHDIHCAVKYSGRIIHMDGGILFDGTVDEYKKSKIGAEFIGGHKHD